MISDSNGLPFFCRKRGILLLFFILLLSAAAGCLFGSVSLSPVEWIGGLWNEPGFETQNTILCYIRIPRVAAGILAGVGLSVSGVLLQTVTGNNLAGPNIIGVNAGAGFACALVLSFFPALWSILPFFAFIGALVTTLVILAVAKKINASDGTVILSGIACTALLNAAISLLTVMDPDILSSYNAFSVGGLAGVSLHQLCLPAIIIVLSLLVSLALSRHIYSLCLGTSIAQSLGVNTRIVRAVCLICASASAAAVVSFAGLLGFVGLIVPHIGRRLCGHSTRRLLVISSLIGSILVVLADLAGRVILAPTEISVGILMAFIGAPFFFILLMKRRRQYDPM